MAHREVRISDRPDLLQCKYLKKATLPYVVKLESGQDWEMLPFALNTTPSSAFNFPLLRYPWQSSNVIKFVELIGFDVIGAAVLRATLDAGGCITADEVCEAEGTLPGALRFLVGTGGAVLISGLSEKLDIPGRWSFGAHKDAALEVAVGPFVVALDERRVLIPDDFSPSP